MEATKGPLRRLEAVFESILDHRVWSIKRCAIKNVKRLYEKIGGLDHLEATKGLLRKLEAVFESIFDHNVVYQKIRKQKCLKAVQEYQRFGPFGGH